MDAVKRITGEDLVKGEYKGGKFFTFYSQAKLIFSANEMPRSLDEKSEAFYRRLLVIHIWEKGMYIPDLQNGLEKDMPGFIAECVRALSRLYERGGEIDSENSKKLVHELYREADSVFSFLDDRMEKQRGSRVERGKLYQFYRDYCFGNDWEPIGARGFYKDLRTKGYAECKTNGGRYFKDICPKSEKKCPARADNEAKRASFENALPSEIAIFTGNS